MESIVITHNMRTPLVNFQGQFKNLSAVELGGCVANKVAASYGQCIDTLYMGCVLSAGLGQSPARQVAIKADLNNSINCININKVCGSGLCAIMMAYNAIIAGESEIVIAGGMESMTNAPYLLEKARFGYRFGDGKITDHMVKDGLLDAYNHCVMGEYAEETAQTYNLSKSDQDDFAFYSFTKAQQAMQAGIFKNEIIPMEISTKKSTTIIDSDEIPFSVDINKISSLKSAFKKDGTITAASASSISDGAAAMLIMKESTAKKIGVMPVAKIIAHASFSQSPNLFTTAPIGAIKKLLKKSNWDISDVDLFEINEAFAVVTMATAKELHIPLEKINIFGGACALGHPLGASGARIIVTLINALKTKKLTKGVAALCVGGGEGVALSLKIF